METENQKNYEISFLARGEEGAGIIIKYLNQLGGEILNEGSIDSVKLAYPIKKHEVAYFGYIHFRSSTELIEPLKEALKFEESILRYLIITPPFVKEVPVGVEESKVGERREITPAPPRRAEGGLSNEDLEAKLEEISGSLPSQE